MNIDFSTIPSPCYVIEEQKLLGNLLLMQRIQDESGAKIILALKGFANYKTFGLINQYLTGATASSLFEAKLCKEELGKKAHMCCPAYLESEMEELKQISSHITFNSLNQWNLYKDNLRSDIKYALRINPEYSEVEADIYNPCVAGSRLGVRRSDLGTTLPEGITGLHFHSLCENNSYTLENTLNAIEKNFKDFLHQIDWINMGGGHLMTQKDYDVPHLIQLLKNFKEKYKVEIFMEPGGAVAWQIGFLKSTVLDIFDSSGINAVIIDSSISNHMPDCIEMPYKPKIRNATDAIKGKTVYRIGGMTCLAGDFVGDYSFENDLKIGDTLIFEDMIHYTTVKNNMFNGINLPSIGIIKMDGTFELLNSFGYEDYKRKL